ncbi:MAG: PorP/SprF family type IX secretion system membrane protein [Putridiphycobacter sp.]
MNNFKKLILGFLLIQTPFILEAQNQFNMGQYALYQPFVNPAAIGTFDNINFAILYKKQWTNFVGSPHLQGFNFNMPIGEGKKHFAGFNFLNDKAGLNNSTELSGTYAYKIRTSTKSRLIFGLSASLNLVRSDLSSASIIDANDPLYTSSTPMYPLPNFKFGTYYYFKNFYVGFVMPNILENKVVVDNGTASGFYGFNPKNMHYYLHMGYKKDLKNENSLVVSTLIKEVAGAPLNIDLNFNFMFKQRFGIGLNMRSSKDAMAIVSMYIMPELLLSYGYEYGFSDLSQFNNGTHEILLVYKVKGANETLAFPRL